VPFHLTCQKQFDYQLQRRYAYKKKQHEPPSKTEEKRKNLSPRNTKACHSIITALLQSIAEIGSHSTIKSKRKTLHELSPHIPQKTDDMPNES
jgi:hypothetical protein